jgi:modulator of FtsH protease
MSEIAGWESFLVAMVGAAAALAGLLVVAISINLREIIRYPSLPGRAAETIVIVAGALVASGLALMPDQSLRVVGIELAIVSVFVWVFTTTIRVRQRRRADSDDPDPRAPHTQVGQVVLIQLATVPPIVASVLLMSGVESGMYVFAVGVMAAFIAALVNAWVLLVEVLR